MALIRILSAPGIQRDGTRFDSDAYTEGTWCRFNRGRPQKMGGYREMSRGFASIGRGMHMDTVGSSGYVHVGTSSLLQRLSFNVQTGVASAVTDRTPAGFATSANNLWQFDSEFDTGTNLNYMLAHAAPNMADIANDTAAPVYFGTTTSVAALTPITSSSVSGGLVVLHPYNVIFGSDGYLAWSEAGRPTSFVGVGATGVRPTADKIVRGLPLRAGPSNSPAGLFWSLNSLCRLMFVGGSSIFSFDTITSGTSIMSAASVIEHNGTYYWISLGGFMMFNGVIRDIDNDFNEQWFLHNVNMTHAQKIFATKVPCFGEIWWCYPRGSATECDHAIVFNYQKGFWFDTPLHGNGRSSAVYEQVFPYPLMTDAGLNSSARYSLWQHEFGKNEISGVTPTTLAIKSSFRTNQISVITPSERGPGESTELNVRIVEPDFDNVGELRMRVFGAPNAMMATPVQLGSDIIIPEPGTGSIDELPVPNVTQSLLQFEFESNVVDGDYTMGKVLADVEPEGTRRTS